MWRRGRDRLGGVSGRLVLGGAPLGQPGDVGPRLREVMASADVLAVEDTRRLHRLAADLGVTFTGRVVTFHESVELARVMELAAVPQLQASENQSQYFDLIGAALRAAEAAHA